MKIKVLKASSKKGGLNMGRRRKSRSRAKSRMTLRVKRTKINKPRFRRL